MAEPRSPSDDESGSLGSLLDVLNEDSFSQGELQDDIELELHALQIEEPRVVGLPPASKKHVMRVFALILAYLAVGSTLTLYNKWILSDVGFNFPITMILTHTAIIATVTWTLALTTYRSRLERDEYWPDRLKLGLIARRVVPVGCLLSLDITLSNAAFIYSSIPFVEVIKSGIPLLVLVFGIVTKRESFSYSKQLVVVGLCIGIVLTSAGELQFSLTGFLLGAAATVSGAIRLVLMQILLTPTRAAAGLVSSPLAYDMAGLGDTIHPFLSVVYFSSVGAISLIVPWVAFDSHRLPAFLAAHSPGALLGYLLMGSVLALGLNMVEVFLIEASSALTMCIAGIVKLVLLIPLNSIFFSYTYTVTGAVGIVICIVGIGLYNYIRYRETLDRAKQEYGPPDHPNTLF